MTPAVSKHVLPALFAILLTSSVFLTTPGHGHNQGFDTDGAIYGTMAGSRLFDPGLARQAPYCYRILTPYLASALPWATLDSFRVLAFLSNALSLYLLFRILRGFDFSVDLSVLGVLLYAGIFWTLKFSFYSPAYIDYQTQLFLLLIIWLTVSGRYLLLVPVLVLSALQKESLAAYGLFAAARLFGERQQRPWLPTTWLLVSLVGLPLLALALVRQVVPADNTYDRLNVLAGEAVRLADPRDWPLWLQSTFSGLGLLPPLLALRYGAWLAFLRKHAEWTVYLGISLLFLLGGEDKGRLFLYALPLLVLFGLHVAKALKTDGGGRRFLIWAVVAVSLHLFVGGYLTPMGSFDDYLSRMVPEHSNGDYRPFAIRNGLIALIFMAFTVRFVIVDWSFAAASGFVRRGTARTGR